MVVEKVICFKGARNQGKSEIIRRILNEFFKITIVSKLKRDFCLHFFYKGKKIGICSYGDYPGVLKEFLIPLERAGCQIIICASHLGGGLTRDMEKRFGGHIKDILCRKKDGKSKKIRDNKRYRKFETRMGSW